MGSALARVQTTHSDKNVANLVTRQPLMCFPQPHFDRPDFDRPDFDKRDSDKPDFDKPDFDKKECISPSMRLSWVEFDSFASDDLVLATRKRSQRRLWLTRQIVILESPPSKPCGVSIDEVRL